MRKPLSIAAVVLVLAVCFMPVPARASMIGFSFNGTVTSSAAQVVSGIPVGTAFTGSVSLTVVPDSNLSPDIGSFILTGPNSLNATLGGNTVTGAVAGSILTFDAANFFQLGLTNLGGSSVNGYTPIILNILIFGTNLASADVLAVPPLGSINSFSLIYQNAAGAAASVSGALTSLQEITSVPEPSTMALLGIGLVGAAVVRYRRRR